MSKKIYVMYRGFDVTNKLTGRWKIINQCGLSTLYMEVNFGGRFFKNNRWIQDILLHIDETEEFINTCGEHM